MTFFDPGFAVCAPTPDLVWPGNQQIQTLASVRPPHSRVKVNRLANHVSKDIIPLDGGSEGNLRLRMCTHDPGDEWTFDRHCRHENGYLCGKDRDI